MSSGREAFHCKKQDATGTLHRKADENSSLYVFGSPPCRDTLPTMAKMQPCRCGHSKSIHYIKPGKEKILSKCWFPKCKCQEYKPKG